jgi:hypothetical protein
MGAAMIPTTVFSYAYLFLQTPIVRRGACTSVSGTGVLAQKWLFPLANMLFDVLACVLCSIRLLRNIFAEKGIQGVSKVLLQDGLGYFGVVMVGHILNLIFTRSPVPAKQTSFFTFNVALSSILAQRISMFLSLF